MSDTNENINIQFNISGVDTSSLNTLVTFFKNIDEQTKSAAENIKKVIDTLGTINKIKLPDMESFSKGITAITQQDATVGKLAENFDHLQENIRKVSDLSLPSLKPFAQGVASLISQDAKIGNLASNFDYLQTNITKISDLKVPGLGQFVSGLEAISKETIKLDRLSKVFDSIKANIEKVQKLSLPKLSSFANGAKTLSEVSFNAEKLKKNFDAVKVAVDKVNGIRIPTFTPFINSVERLMKINIGALNTKITGLSNAIERLDQSGKLATFSEFARNLSNAAKAINVLEAAEKSAKKETSKFADMVKYLRTEFARYSKYRIVADVVMKLKEALLGGIKAIIDYDQALKDLQAITGATDVEVAKMGETILNVAASTKFSATEIAEGMRTISQAGFSATESMEAMQGISDLATGTLSTMDSTVDLVTTALRVFNLEAYRTNEVVDVFANAVNKSKLTVDKLKTAFNYVGPVAENAGVSLKELSAAMMTLANAGLRPSTIGTGLRQVFATLLSPTKAFTKAIEASGVSMESLDLQSNSLQSVIEALKLVVTDAGVAFDAFGKRGASAVLALVEGDDYLEMAGHVEKVGTAARQAEKQMEGLGVMLKNLKDRLGVLAIAIGDLGLTDVFKVMISLTRTFIELLTALVNNPLVKVIGKFTSWTVAIGATVLIISKLKSLITILSGKVLLGLIGSLINLTRALGGTTTAMVAMEGPILATGTAFTTFSASVRAAAAAMWSFVLSNPITAVIAGIVVAVTGAIIYFTQYKKSLSEVAQETKALSEEYETLGDKVENYLERIKDMEEGSEDLKRESISMRNELIKTAKEYPELYKQAMEAADSIDIFSGKMIDGGEAMKSYQEKVNEIKLDKLKESIETGLKAVADSNKLAQYAELVKANIKGILTFSPSEASETFKQIREGLKVVDLFAQNTIESFTKAGIIIRSWKMDNISDFQKEQVKNYELLHASFIDRIAELKKEGKVTEETTVEAFKEIAKQTGYSKEGVIGLIAVFAELQKKQEEAAANIKFTDYGAVMTPEKVEAAFKEYTMSAKTAYEEYLHEIALLEAKGSITAEEAAKRRIEAEIEHYEETLRKATEYYNTISGMEGDNGKELAKALKAKETAEAALYDKRKDFLVKYTKEATKANDKIIKINDKYIDEVDKHETKIQKVTKDSKIKLEKLHDEYIKKLEKIDETYEKTLEKIEDKRAKNKKKNLEDLYDIELDASEAIRKIREESMTDEQKQNSQRVAALKYLQDGMSILRKFDVKITTEADLDRAKNLLKTAMGMTDAFDSQRKKIGLVQDATEALKKVSNYERELNDAKLLTEEQEALTKKKEDTQSAEDDYAKKIKASKDATEDLINEENKRHKNELSNHLKELNLYKEKLRVARELVRLSGGDVDLSKTITYEAKIDDLDFESIKKEAENAFSDIKKSASTVFSDNLYESIDENGVRTFSNIGSAGEEAFKDISNASKSMEIDPENKIETFKNEVFEIKNLPTEYDLTASVFGIPKIDELISKINGLKDKTITVATRYVTEGAKTITAATGMRIPGFGGGDRRPALLEDGEWVINKFSVRKYGDAFMQSLNNMSLPRFSVGGIMGRAISSIRMPNTGTTESLLVRFQAGDLEAPVKITDTSSRLAMKRMAREMSRMRMVYAK